VKPSFEAFLDQVQPGDSPPAQRVCLVSTDFVGVVKNGGIGTSFLHTADVLTAAGLDVDLLFVNPWAEVDAAVRESATEFYAARGIRLTFLFDVFPVDLLKTFRPQIPVLGTSFLTYQYLKDLDYDVVIFPEWKAPGYCSVLAKSQGLAFEHTALVVQTHSSSLWHSLNNQAVQYGQADVIGFRMERDCVRLADMVTSPTQYLADWMEDHGFVLPAHTYVQPLLLVDDAVEAATGTVAVTEFVFFGRLEERKGLRYFLEAVDRFAKTATAEELQGVTVSFLGKITGSPGGLSIDRIYDHAAKWPDAIEVKVLSTLDSAGAQEYLAGEGRVAMVCSVADNSPFAVLECLYGGVPFLASNVGGIPELVPEEFHATHLMELRSPDIAERMLEVRRNGHRACGPRVHQSGQNIPAWVDTVRRLPASLDRPAAAPEPRITLCITHYNRAEMLARTFAGVQAQTYQNFEVIVVDDGSTDPAAVELISSVERGEVFDGARVLHQKNQFVGAARNRGLAEATGEYVVFMDDDNFADPHQLETFVRAITATGADALACAAITFGDDEDPNTLGASFENLFLPPGMGYSAALFANNHYGDANAIYRRSALEAVGGYTRDYGLSWEDAELFARLEVEGFAIGLIPESLMYLRKAEGSVSHASDIVANAYRALRPHLENFPWETWGDALLVAAAPSLTRIANDVEVPEERRVPAARNARHLVGINDDGTLGHLRAIARYLDASDRTDRARALLLDTALSASANLELLTDVSLLTSDAGERSEVRATLEALAPSAHREAALGMLDLLSSKSTDRARSALDQARKEHPEVVTYGLFGGMLEVIDGDANIGAALIAGAFEHGETVYLANNGDVALALATNTDGLGPQTGLAHYLEFGRAEGRNWPLSTPGRNPLAELVADAAPPPENERIANQLAVASVGLDWVGLCQVWNRLLVSDYFPALALTSRTISDVAESTYLAQNNDVNMAVQGGTLGSGYAHFLGSGAAEGRAYPMPVVSVRRSGARGAAERSVQLLKAGARRLRDR
jgi:GT2 family glycosyltransferase/glycosyltransferase involved in cell wall biosynthesis